MDFFIKILFIVLLSVFGLVCNINLSTNEKATEYLKEDLETAVHDAALFQEQEELANGLFVFDKTKAEEQFRESFDANSGLSDGDYKILEFKVFDQSNSTFPVKYQASTVEFSDVFTGPTIVAVIETKVKNYFSGGTEDKIIRVASYSYETN